MLAIYDKIARLLSRDLDRSTIVSTLVNEIALSLSVRCVACFSESAYGFEPEATTGCNENVSCRILRMSDPLLKELSTAEGWMRIEADPLPSDISAEEKRLFVELETAVLVPMRVNSVVTGFLSLSTTTLGHPPDEDRLRELFPAITTLAGALQLCKYQDAISQDLEHASEIQGKLLHMQAKEYRAIDSHVIFRPARTVSGDFYDFVHLNNNKVAIIVGDVAGKGIAAALIMSNIIVSLRRAIQAGAEDLADLMGDLHTIIYESSPEGRYATLFYGIFDPVRFYLQYVNAGHQPPALLLRNDNGEVRTTDLTIGGSVLGLFGKPREPYDVGWVALSPGDALIIANQESDIEGILRGARDAGGSLVSINPIRRSLEDLFVAQTRTG